MVRCFMEVAAEVAEMVEVVQVAVGKLVCSGGDGGGSGGGGKAKKDGNVLIRLT